MLTLYSHFPKQIRALDAIKRLKTYFEAEGNTEKEPLPTMAKIVDYCIRSPRLLTVRDSPLRVLHDPKLPYVVVHDWYIGISLDYLEASILVLLEQWEKDYRKKRHDDQQIADLFFQLVKDIFECYEHTSLALKLPFPEGSALSAAELKDKVKYATVALVKEKISHTFIAARDIFYAQALKNTERLFRVTSRVNEITTFSKRMKFDYLFSPGLSEYQDEDLEYQVQTIIDSDLPELVDIFNLSNEMLKASCDESYCNDALNDIPLDSWLFPEEPESIKKKATEQESDEEDFTTETEEEISTNEKFIDEEGKFTDEVNMAEERLTTESTAEEMTKPVDPNMRIPTPEELKELKAINPIKMKLEKKKSDFKLACDQLNELSLTPNWTAILMETIKKRLDQIDTEDWSLSMVHPQLKWLHVLILPWMSYIIPKSEDKNANWNAFLREKIKAEHVLYEMIYQARIPNIFDLIREFPQSENAVDDLHIVTTKRGLLDNSKDKLLDELQTRLLHQGASAIDVLEQYKGCITCLSIIDPSCSIMVPVIDLIENYMKTYRKDVVQGVVELIRDDEAGLLESLDESEIYVFKQSELNNEEIPRDTVIIKEDKPAMLRRLQEKSRDPVAMLISMCNSLKDFIKGYSDRLGEELLSTKNYDTDAEVHRLELLKRHFPPDTFIRCDIMLRDIDDSRRLDKSIHDNREISKSFHSIILSRCYWPGGEEDEDMSGNEEEDESKVQLWPGQQSTMEKYDAEYRKKKGSRKLKFLPITGSVTLELEFKSGKIEMDVRPEAALIIALFESKEDRYTKDDIAAKVGISKSKVVECLDFWVEKKILKLSAKGLFYLLKD